jgi:hypothetical protein
MEVTKWLKPSIGVSRIGGSVSVQALTRVNADLGANHFARRDRSKAIRRLLRRLNDLGCEVQLTTEAA